MDLKPTAAKLTNERHKGAFATGDSLNLTAQLKPVDAAPVKVVQIDTTHKIIEIAPGVKFSAWTFGDQVPGPAIRARVGDKIRFSMTNRSDETAPGIALTAAPMLSESPAAKAPVWRSLLTTAAGVLKSISRRS